MKRSKLRWRIAHLLDRSSRFCWANLVPWALYGREHYTYGERIADVQRGAECRAESLTHRDRTCYCGKFRDGCLAKAVSDEV